VASFEVKRNGLRDNLGLFFIVAGFGSLHFVTVVHVHLCASHVHDVHPSFVAASKFVAARDHTVSLLACLKQLLINWTMQLYAFICEITLAGAIGEPITPFP
jgi:hypothetical protein